ncbi:MAG: MBL fold metallo-hydrolase [Chlorobi bacterium]|nr:MBL fold metallo-hydrolase [Chlorobiota bacterium]
MLKLDSKSKYETMKIFTLKLGVTNCYLLQEKGTVLIDAGESRKCGKFLAELKKLGVAPEEISLIVVTHTHWDHIGCAKRIQALTKAKVAVHANEKRILENGELSMPPGATRWGKFLSPIFAKWSEKFNIEPVGADIIIENALSLEEYGIDAEAIFTPGHSSGSVSVLLPTGEAFVGDAAMNMFPLTFRPGPPIFAEDLNGLKKSWQTLINKGAKKIFPAHGKPFDIELIKRQLFG